MAGICDGRVVIVTGAGRGLGRAHALESQECLYRSSRSNPGPTSKSWSLTTVPTSYLAEGGCGNRKAVGSKFRVGKIQSLQISADLIT